MEKKRFINMRLVLEKDPQNTILVLICIKVFENTEKRVVNIKSTRAETLLGLPPCPVQNKL